jgi:hypothetical protein
MEESLNEIKFQAPDKYEQKVLSIRTTFPWNSEDVNPMGMINSSLYEPDIEELISPLSPNAFHYYEFNYEGFFDEGNRAVFKIKVTPKQNSQQLMKGTIYIVDQLWCLHSADLSVQMFFGSLGFKIIYSEVKPQVWLPINYQFFVDAGIMGIKATYKYNSSVKFTRVLLNERNIAAIAVVKEQKPDVPAPVKEKPGQKDSKDKQAMEELMKKDELTNRDMIKMAALMSKQTSSDTIKSKSLEIKEEQKNSVTVEKNAVKNDTSFWNSMRPIPLTSIESRISAKRDTTLKISNDSVVFVIGVRNDTSSKWTGKVFGFLTSGGGFHALHSTLYFRYEGLIGFRKFDFNTVDGFLLRQTIRLEEKIDSAHKLIIRPGVAYAFNREQVMWWTDVNYEYAPLRDGKIAIHMGSQSIDYNMESGINSTVNSIASLFFRRNYMKLYQRKEISLENSIELATGLNFNARVGYMAAQPLRNTSDFSFFFRNDRNYSPNFPGDMTADKAARNVYNEEAYWEISFEYTPRYYYRVSGGKKIYEHSMYPTFWVHNKMAIPGVIQSTSDYNLLEVGLKQKKEWGMMHAFSWNAKAGFFINRNKVFTTDDKYFNTQNLPVLLQKSEDAFRLLPFYEYSTDRDFAELHLTFSTPYLLIKYLPFLNNKIWLENLHLNYLTTYGQKHYWEVGYSISQIYMAGSIGVFAGFKGKSYHSYGVQISFNL